MKVDWQLWAFASGKNIKIWAAASLWDVSKLERDKLKDAVAKFKREKEAAENDNKKSKVMSKALGNGASLMDGYR